MIESIKLIIETLKNNDLCISVNNKSHGPEITIGLRQKAVIYNQQVGRAERTTWASSGEIYTDDEITSKEERTTQVTGEGNGHIIKGVDLATGQHGIALSASTKEESIKPRKKTKKTEEAPAQPVVEKKESAGNPKATILAEAESLFKAGKYAEAKERYEAVMNISKDQKDIDSLDRKIKICQSWINRLNDLYGNTDLTPAPATEVKAPTTPPPIIEMPLDLMDEDEDLPF